MRPADGVYSVYGLVLATAISLAGAGLWGCASAPSMPPSPANSADNSAADGEQPLVLDDDPIDVATDGASGVPDVPPAGVENQPPSAVAEAVITDAGIVLLDGTASDDPDGDPLTFAWEQTAGKPTVELKNADSASASFVAPAVTTQVTFEFTLTVSDGELEARAVVTVGIAPPPAPLPPPPPTPLPDLIIVASVTEGEAPLAVEFVVETADGSALPEGVYTWGFGDGATGLGAAISHEYTAPGDYLVEVCTILPGDLAETQKCAGETISVVQPAPPAGGGGGGGGGGLPGGGAPPPNKPPVAVAAVDIANPAEGTLVALNGAGSYDVDGGPEALTYAWSQTQGTSVTSDPQFDAVAVQPRFTAPAYTGVAAQDTLRFALVVFDGADFSVAAGVTVTVAPASTVPPDQRHADLPDSWLVLYNLNHPDSVSWKDWYIAQWNVPAENTLGLEVDPSLERIQRDQFDSAIFFAVHDYLADNPDLSAKVMGILVGYRVPGCFYQDDTYPAMQGGGGWSVANKLAYLNPTWPQIVNVQNPHVMASWIAPDPVRLTKAALTPPFYLTARIDAPTLDEAKALTLRAKAISAGATPVSSAHEIFYDYSDPGTAAGDEWALLRDAVLSAVLNDPPADYPWRAFESDGANEEPTPNCALQFSYYRLTGWQYALWGGAPAGPRVLGYAFNSFGATTVRSTTDHGGRYVPNALFNGGFAAAVGATAEPFVSSGPYPGTMIWCLRDGRTLAEAVFHANPRVAWMWEVVGDPLLTVPSWFTP